MPKLPLVEAIKRRVGMDEAFGCICVDASECCGSLPEALDEIDRLSSKLDQFRKLLMEASCGNRDCAQQPVDVASLYCCPWCEKRWEALSDE